jgi:hypothetical protein
MNGENSMESMVVSNESSIRTVAIQLTCLPEYLTRKQKRFIELRLDDIQCDIESFVKEIRDAIVGIDKEYRAVYMDRVNWLMNRIDDPMPKNRAIIYAWVELNQKVFDIFL